MMAAGEEQRESSWYLNVAERFLVDIEIRDSLG